MSARYTRQKYKDVEWDTVNPAAYPIVQLKWDGIWCLCEVDETGWAVYYSRNGDPKQAEQLHHPVPAGCYIGELMFGTQWAQQSDRKNRFHIFDIVEQQSEDLRTLPYRLRYQRLLALFRDKTTHPFRWNLVVNYPTTELKPIWGNLVTSRKFEGVVFRHPEEVWDVQVPRAKYESTLDARVVGYEVGEGKYRNTLGALLCETEQGIPFKCGGGLTDRLRDLFWYDLSKKGCWITVSHKGLFESGKPRHPNFVSFHPDKK